MDILRKNELYDAQITGFSMDGGGVCRIGGRAVFVPRAIPGESWRVRIVKVNNSVVFGRGEELLAPSPARREPPCPVFGKCGGCATLHMEYEKELEFKLGRVRDALQRIGGLDIPVETILGAEGTDSYRNKAIYNFAPGPVGGFYRARSHDIVSTERCLLQPECFDQAAAALLAWMKEQNIPAYDEKSGRGVIRHLYLRKTAEDFAACIVAAGRLPAGAAEVLRRACPELTGVLLCINAEANNTVLTPDIHVLWGSEYTHESLCSARFRLSPLTFFQINTRQAERLYELVREYGEPTGKTVLDLYCGAGSIGLSVARDAKMLIGSDIVPDAVENAKHNARENGVENCEYLCGDASEVAVQLAERGLKPDLIVVDPPRKGITPDVIDAVVTMAPDTLVYVSCDPGTLARDLKILGEKGYAATQVTAVDMFPGTRHVESVVKLVKRK